MTAWSDAEATEVLFVSGFKSKMRNKLGSRRESENPRNHPNCLDMSPIQLNFPCSVIVTQLSVGDAHVLVLSRGGVLFSSGAGSHGELGDGYKTVWRSTLLPVPLPAPESAVVFVSAGYAHSAVICSPSRLVYTFGNGSYHRLGHGDDLDRVSPSLVQALRHAGSTCVSSGLCAGFAAVACGRLHTVAVTLTNNTINNNNTNTHAHHNVHVDSCQEVYGWGYNKFSQLCFSPSVTSTSTSIDTDTRTDTMTVGRGRGRGRDEVDKPHLGKEEEEEEEVEEEVQGEGEGEGEMVCLPRRLTALDHDDLVGEGDEASVCRLVTAVACTSRATMLFLDDVGAGGLYVAGSRVLHMYVLTYLLTALTALTSLQCTPYLTLYFLYIHNTPHNMPTIHVCI